MLSKSFKKAFLPKNELIIFGLLTIILCLPAFLINLGITPLIEDEATRALVTLEMDISHHYITPTIGGSLYYNKPPLFNWIVLPFFRAGGANELMLRLPVVISLLLFSITLFLTLRKHLGNRVAFTSALLFLTCGRIIVYESLKGLIDIVFSWILYSNFIILYNGIKKQKFLQTFIVSYLLLSLAFMLKGIPALVFQALTVSVLLFLQLRWKMFQILFSIKHLVGILLLILLTGTYYLMYFHLNPGTENDMLSVIFQQSARRTALRFGIFTTLAHLFTYPLEFFKHFLPWTILVVYFFKKDSKQYLSHDFIKACMWVFLFNITIYWLSPESFARYVLMLVPLLYIVMIYLFEKNINVQWIMSRILFNVLLMVLVMITLFSISIPFLDATAHQPFAVVKAFFLFATLGTITWFYIRQRRNMLIYTGLFLLVVRIGFDWFVLPHRVEHMHESINRQEAKRIGRFINNHETYVYGPAFKDFNEDTRTKYISFFTRFYIASESHQIIRDSDEKKSGCFYLVREKDIQNKPYVRFPEPGTVRDKEPRFVVQFKP